MKKFIPVILVVLILIGIGAYVANQRQGTPATDSSQPASEMPAQSQQTPEKSSVINSIKDAMGFGEKMKCTYSDPENASATSTIFIDGQKVKFMTAANNETMYGIFDGKTQYMWTTGKTKQGFKMDESCMDEIKQFSSQLPGGSEIAPVEDFQELDSAQNVQCEPAKGEDFSIPSDINFIDQCEVLRNSMKALDQMKQNLPNGTQIPVRY